MTGLSTELFPEAYLSNAGTWTVPALGDIHVENYSVRNSTHWLWLFENPSAAHSNYATDKRAIKEMLTSNSDAKK